MKKQALGGFLHFGPASLVVDADDDGPEQLTQQSPHLVAVLFPLEQLLQPHHRLPIGHHHVVDRWHCYRRRARQHRLEFSGLGLGGPQAGLQGRAEPDLGYGIHQAGDLGLEGRVALRCGIATGVDIFRDAGQRRLHLAPELAQRVRAEELLPNLCQQPLVQYLPLHGMAAWADGRPPVLACAAAVAVAVDSRHRSPTGVAPEHAAEQGARRSSLADAGAAAAGLQPGRGGFPQLLADDAKRRVFTGLPLVARPLHVPPCAGVGVLQPLPAVPDDPPGVQLVGQHPESFGSSAIQRADCPGAASCAGHSAPVELIGNCPGALPVDVAPEHFQHDRRFDRVYHQPAAAGGFLAAVSVGAPAGGEAAVELASQAAVGLLTQVVEVQLVDEAPRDAHDLAPARLAVIAIGGADDPDSTVLEPLDELLRLADFAAQPVQAFDDQHLPSAGQRIGEQCFAAATQCNRHRATDPLVRVGGDDGPALAIGALPCGAQLVSDARLTLLVGAVAGVQGCPEECAHQRPSGAVGGRRAPSVRRAA